ncbi:endospore germination permease [Saccharococcus caldoxylosilyticus]|uniref:GerAB/ArcD/ProY family transporter n=1 Tax=Saccharococcus caldoxylosilyticus TaxID=81408 RepID=UPI001C4DE246|nr:endospore germination permease [Parageobacillus caldoxylosilyticus]QXJ39820.1 Spore germination protein YndE [Parageobacillus caldoxylosilyticus]BDG36578.1 germination protein [Parageobacillus caldoxylosilyticus]BDG40366.1 germination protein [Parageobacillus caldoxylosilyticus]BDG44117.1 germination protein [Parageobacillus caldoxylosilyticus]
MIEKGKISAAQMGMMMYPTIIATAILLVPAITARHAKQDMWLSPLWASLIGFLTVYITVRLHELYPEKTIIEYSEDILGKFLGKVIGLIFLFYYLYANGIIIREYGEFVVGNFLFYTPLVVVMGSMVLACSFAVRSGVEVIGRLAQMIVPIVIILIVINIILLIRDMEVANMFPIMEKGIMPSLKGSIIPQGWFSEFLLIAFLLPYVADRNKGKRWGMISVAAVMLTLSLVNIAVLFVLGGITDRFTYPAFSAVRYISIADFLEHIEAIVMALWVAGIFMKVAVFYYALVLGTAQWMNLEDYRPIIFPMGFLILLFAVWSAPSLMELTHYLGSTSPFYRISIQVGIPLLLLFVAKWRKRANNQKLTQQG